MIKIETLKIAGMEEAIYGMRNPKNSWDRSDSEYCHMRIACEGCPAYDKTDLTYRCKLKVEDPFDSEHYILGPNDHKLAMSLAKGGPVHAKYRRFIDVWFNVTAPLYWWKEFDTYRVGVVDNPSDLEYNSCSTMHKIHEKEFTLDDFSHEHISDLDIGDGCMHDFGESLENTIRDLNLARKLYLETKDKKYWWQMIQLLPSSYNQMRTVKCTYEVLANIYRWRADHKQDEWNEDFDGSFCSWIKALPYSELITLEENNEKDT